MKKIKKLYIDLDAVLADFDKSVYDKFSLPLDPAKRNQAVMWRMIEQDDRFYYHLPKMPDADQLMTFLSSLGVPMEILSAIPTRKSLASAEKDKQDWVREQISPNLKVNIGPYSKDKKNWAKPDFVLIDDRIKNIEEWNAAGGIGIFHTSAADTIKQLQTIMKE